MGDIQIPGASFVITIPDDWECMEIGSEAAGPILIFPAQTGNVDIAPQIIFATHPGRPVAAYYTILGGNSLADTAQPTVNMMNTTPSWVSFSMKLNGMDCIVCNGSRYFFFNEWYPLLHGGESPPPNVVPADGFGIDLTSFTLLFVENQGAILYVEIYQKETPIYAIDPDLPLLLMSGIWPAAPEISKKEPALHPTKGSHPLKLPDARKKVKPFKMISHAKIEKKVSVPRRSKLGTIPENTRKWLEHLKILQELYNLLKKDTKYADYVDKLAKIIKAIESVI